LRFGKFDIRRFVVGIDLFPFTKEKKNDLKKELKISILSLNIDEL